MNYQPSLIRITTTLGGDESMYSMILLRASALSIMIGDTKCFLDGLYLLCLSIDDRLTVKSGSGEALNMQFLPYFYNVNLDHQVIGLSLYEEMRSRHGYPDFHLFLTRNDEFCGVVPLTSEEYDIVRSHFTAAAAHIEAHERDPLWSCRTRSDMISVLRVAENAYSGGQRGEVNEIIRYIRENPGRPLTLPTLCSRFHTNRTTLSRIIKTQTGMTPTQYVLEERLSQSCPDLLFTMLSITDLAEKYGFSDVNYYIRAFRRRFGKTPLQYRNEGRADRIRNEEGFRERARTMIKMTVSEFESYIRKGLGRAILRLKDIEDKAPYRRAFLESVRGNRLDGRALGIYEKEIIDCFEDKEALALELFDACMPFIRAAKHMHAVPLLMLLGFGHEAEQAVEEVYQKNYAKLVTCGNDEHYPDCAARFCMAAGALGRYFKNPTRIKQIFLDIAELYRQNDHPPVPTLGSPVFYIMDGIGREATFALMEEVAAEHPLGNRLLENSELRFCRHDEDIDSIRPDPNITAEEYLACHRLDSEFRKRYISFLHASPEVIEQVIQGVLAEKDPAIKHNLMMYFVATLAPDSLMPLLPIDPAPILELAKSRWVEICNTNFPRGVISPLLFPFYLLSRIRHPDVKAYAKSLRMDRRTPDEVRKYACIILYDANYEPEDKNDFINFIMNDVTAGKELSFELVLRGLRRKTPGMPTEMLPYIYENVASHNRRHEVVKQMIELDLLTESLRTECAYDCNKHIRKLVKGKE